MSTTVSTVLSYVEIKTQAGTGTLNNTTTGVPFLNEGMLEYRTALIEKGIDAAQIQEGYIATVSVPTYPNTSTFAFPSTMFILKNIWVNMTDSTQQNYIQATELDLANIPFNNSLDWVRVNQSNQSPMFDNHGDTYEIFPTFKAGMNLTNAIKMVWYLQPTPYVNLSDPLTYPDSLDYYILALFVSAIYYESLNKLNEANSFRIEAKARMTRNLKTVEKPSEVPIQPTNSYPTGFQY